MNADPPNTPLIRPLTSSDYPAAVRVLRELRPQLQEGRFGEVMSRQLRSGYELIGAFLPELVGVLGMRLVETLARGRYLHVDDLVVTESQRMLGIGRALLRYAETEADQRCVGTVFLDSRPEALGFYARLGYAPHGSVLVKKRLPGS